MDTRREVPDGERIMQVGDVKNHLTLVTIPIWITRGETRQYGVFRCACGKETERKCGDVSTGKIKCCGWACPIAHGHAHAGEKRCVKCGETKSIDLFTKGAFRSAGKDGFYAKCQDCQFDYDLRKKFGIDIHEYSRILCLQGGVCAICGGKVKGIAGGYLRKRFDVDHDHNTGKIRGLLCSSCNRAIGLLRDDLSLLRRAVEYLEGSLELIG